MTSTITTTRGANRSDHGRRGHASRPSAGRRAGRRATGTSAASRRAYDRRERRIGDASGSAGQGGAVAALRLGGPRELARRIPFVVLVLALFAAGIGLTLWLTTAATARSYGLADARHQNTVLEDQKEALEKVVQAGNAAPELARKAAELGMVQAKDVARLVVAPDGSVTVEGDPKPAEGPKPGDLSRVPATTKPAPTPAPTAALPVTPDAQGVLPPADAVPGGTQVLAAAAPTPAAQPPAAQEPAAQPPAAQEPADQLPAAQQPAAPSDAAPIAPADAAPIAPADAARGAAGPAAGAAPGAH